METQEAPEEIIQKHRKERKELQAKIQALKKSATKGDKKKKKEVQEEIAKLESEMDQRHEEELAEFSSTTNNANITTVTDSLNNLTVQPEDDEVPGLTQHRITKAQRRREKKATQLKQRELSITEQEVQNLQGVRNVEIQKIQEILKKRDLMVYEIPSDGNCLYCAVEHQLQTVKGPTAPSMADLRHITSDFLRENMDDFLPFLSHPDTGEILTESQFQEYCDQVADTPAWGGQVELRALSHALKCRIEVIQATGPPMVVGEEYPDSHQLTITYHRHMYGLGEHYNSVTQYVAEETNDETWNGQTETS
uniref:ubiquitinyl hydrolase 1 n=1 Tax=Cuerna arida TaxID=1464854 RepID=A0A1B6EJC5_9HEMI